jgi:hypothetical protein
MTGIDLGPALERINVARAKYSVEYDGKLLPVTNLLDSEGVEVFSPIDASRCVCYDESAPDGEKWRVIWGLDPGDIRSICDGK